MEFLNWEAHHLHLIPASSSFISVGSYLLIRSVNSSSLIPSPRSKWSLADKVVPWCSQGVALGHPKDTTIQGCSSAFHKTAQGSGPSERAGPTPMDTEGRLYRSLRHSSLPMAVLRGRVGLSFSCPDSLAPPTHLLRVNYSFSILPWWLRWQSICLQCRRPGFKPWAGKISWRRKWHTTAVFFPEKSHGRRSLVGYSPWGHKESDTTRLHCHFHFILSQQSVRVQTTLFSHSGRLCLDVSS